MPALLPLRFVLPAGTQGPGGSAESHLLWDHLHAGERSSPLGQERYRTPPWGGAVLPRLAPLPSPQNPAVVDAPLRLVLQVSAPPRCVIKPSGTSVSVSAFLNISLVPADRPAVQLSSMAMVGAAAASLPVPAQVHRAGALHPTWDVTDILKMGAAPRLSRCLPMLAAAGFPCSSLSP